MRAGTNLERVQAGRQIGRGLACSQLMSFRHSWVRWMVAAVVVCTLARPAAQEFPATTAPGQQPQAGGEQPNATKSKRGDVVTDTPDWETQIEELAHAFARLPTAA